jgi:hypothetical protein
MSMVKIDATGSLLLSALQSATVASLEGVARIRVQLRYLLVGAFCLLEVPESPSFVIREGYPGSRTNICGP